MLDSSKDLMCGIFDSNVIMRNKTKSELREVSCYELELFPEAIGVSHVDGETYPVKKGMLLIAKPGQKRFSQLPIKCYYVRLFNTDCTEASIVASLPIVTYLDAEDFDRLCSAFLRLGACYINSMDKTLCDLKVNSLLYDILYRIQKRYAPGVLLPTKHEDNQTVLKAKEYMDENFCGRCSLSEIAEHIHISPNYLHTLFSEQTGISPFTYVIERRVELAKRMILAGNNTLLEIALETGFSSQSHFNKIFKKKTGYTPAEYRRKITAEYDTHLEN